MNNYFPERARGIQTLFRWLCDRTKSTKTTKKCTQKVESDPEEDENDYTFTGWVYSCEQGCQSFTSDLFISVLILKYYPGSPPRPHLIVSNPNFTAWPCRYVSSWHWGPKACVSCLQVLMKIQSCKLITKRAGVQLQL